MIKIHQTLHGYDHGHHLLTSTILLRRHEDQSLMAVMSDWDGYEPVSDIDGSYLTTYPLSEEYYVVAMTWYAAEMERPGCVWTHSLLLKKTDLDKVSSFMMLLKCFKRPALPIDFSVYGNVIEMDETEKDSDEGVITEYEGINIAEPYAMLLEQHHPLVFHIDRSSAFYQRFILRLMNIIPGGILSALSLCSGSFSPRKIGDGFLNMQFVTKEQGSYSQLFTKSDYAVNTVGGFINNSFINNKSELRQLLQLFEEDIKDSPKVWFLVINIFLQLYSTNGKSAEEKRNIYLNIINDISTAFPRKDDGVRIKSRMTLPAITRMVITDRQFLVECASNEAFGTFTQEQVHLEDRLVQLFRDESHREYIELLKAIHKRNVMTELGMFIFYSSANVITDADFETLLNEDYSVLVSLIPYDNSILNHEAWLTAPKETFDKFLIMFNASIPNAFNKWNVLFDAVLRNGSIILGSLPKTLWEKTETPVAKLLDFLNGSDQHVWINPELTTLCRNNKKAMLSWLRDNSVNSQDIVRFFIQSFDPEGEDAQSEGAETWKPLSETAVYKTIEFYVFFYNLSFNWPHSELAFEYFRMSFYPIYRKAETNTLPYYSWKKIEHNTAKLSWISSWDRCKKMRVMAADRFKSAGKGLMHIAGFTPDSKVNKDIMDFFTKTSFDNE